MNWEAVGAISEILAAIAVIVTLIYLARQFVKDDIKLQYLSAEKCKPWI